jgi:parvulin-like peptidyl-prolyl isomerase
VSMRKGFEAGKSSFCSESGRGGSSRWRYVVSAVFFVLMSGLAGASGAVDIHAAGPKEGAKAAVMTGQEQPAERNKGETAAGQANAEEKVVARVNGVAITGGTLERMMHLIASEGGSLTGKNAEQTDMAEVRKKALDRLIFQELVYQRAVHEHVTVTEQEVDAAIEKIKKRAGGEEAYRKDLEKLSRTEGEERAAVRRSLMIRQLYGQAISGKVITVTDDEMKREYDRQKDKFIIPESVSVIDVVFFLDTGKKQSFEKAEEVRQKILGTKEKNPMNLVPDGTFLVRERTIEKATDKELYLAARKLREGELSGVIKTSDSLHVIQLKKYVPEKRFTFEQMKPFIETQIKSDARQALIQKWEADLKKGATIEVMDADNHK